MSQIVHPRPSGPRADAGLNGELAEDTGHGVGTRHAAPVEDEEMIDRGCLRSPDCEICVKRFGGGGGAA